MFTFSDTFVAPSDSREVWLAAMDETERDTTPDPADFAPDEDSFWAYTDAHAPAHDDDSNHMIVNHYRGI